MGAEPRWVLLSLALPDALRVADVDGLAAGLAELAAAEGVRVIGGNVTRTPGPLIVDITAVGETRPRRTLTRSGGRPGDELVCERQGRRRGGGTRDVAPGSSAAASIPGSDACVARYRRPAPRVRLGAAIAQARAARAAMDLSDGLADAIGRSPPPAGAASRSTRRPCRSTPRRGVVGSAGNRPARGGVHRRRRLRVVDRRSAALARAATTCGVTSRAARAAADRRLTKDAACRVLVRNGQRESLPEGFEHFKGG